MKYFNYILKFLLIALVFLFADINHDLKKEKCCNGDEGKLCYPVKVWRWCHCLCLSDDK